METPTLEGALSPLPEGRGLRPEHSMKGLPKRSFSGILLPQSSKFALHSQSSHCLYSGNPWRKRGDPAGGWNPCLRQASTFFRMGRPSILQTFGKMPDNGSLIARLYLSQLSHLCTDLGKGRRGKRGRTVAGMPNEKRCCNSANTCISLWATSVQKPGVRY